MRRWTRLLRINSVTIGCLLILLVFGLWWADEVMQEPKPFFLVPLSRLELLVSDLRFRVRGPELPGPEVVIAAVDEKSIDQLGRWPWPYTVQAQLVRQLTAYGAAAIGYDVVFSSSDTSAGLENVQKIDAALALRGYYHTPELQQLLGRVLAEAAHDHIFADALRASERTVLGYFFHWNCKDVEHLQATELERYVQNLTVSRNAGYTPRVAPGASLSTLQLPRACAVESNLPVLSQAVWGNGFFNSRPDATDGVIRHYPLLAQLNPGHRPAATDRQHTFFAPLGIRVLERYLQQRDGHASTIMSVDATETQGRAQIWVVTGRQRYEIPMNHESQMVLNHLGPSELRPEEQGAERRYRFPRYSIVDIVQGHTSAAPPEAFRNKMVLVGATATGLSDLRITPFDTAIPGVESHATVIDNVLRQRFLVTPWWGPALTAATIVLLGLVLTLVLPHLGPLRGDLVTVALGLGYVSLNYVLFLQGWLLNIVYPLLSVVLVWAGMTIYHYVVEQRQSRYLRRTFSTYLSPELVTMMARDHVEPKLGGSSGTRTAYFTDIQSFSSFSEVLSAEQLVALLNEYLTAMTDILLAEGGTLDKYEGDAIVAFFGAPIAQPDHAARALRVALRMQQALVSLRARWADEGDKWPDLVKQMRMRIGINAGDIVTGNMGSTMRMNYTMMGDVVNTAARLEASAKQYGVYIQCTLQTLQLAGQDDFEWRYLDKVKVVGKSEAVETVEIMAYKGTLPDEQVLAMGGRLSDELRAMREIYHQGLELYRQQQWDEALARFTESDKREAVFAKRPTTPSRVYIERCAFFKDNPPGPDWDGAWILTSK
ncbi:MAG: CHASE2 domain-containing protein [Candidatus Tectimicrobiota bacterium]